jgi:hypothetical protein
MNGVAVVEHGPVRRAQGCRRLDDPVSLADDGAQDVEDDSPLRDAEDFHVCGRRQTGSPLRSDLRAVYFGWLAIPDRWNMSGRWVEIKDEGGAGRSCGRAGIKVVQCGGRRPGP